MSEVEIAFVGPASESAAQDGTSYFEVLFPPRGAQVNWMRQRYRADRSLWWLLRQVGYDALRFSKREERFRYEGRLHPGRRA